MDLDYVSSHESVARAGLSVRFYCERASFFGGKPGMRVNLTHQGEEEKRRDRSVVVSGSQKCRLHFVETLKDSDQRFASGSLATHPRNVAPRLFGMVSARDNTPFMTTKCDAKSVKMPRGRGNKRLAFLGETS